MKQDRFKTISLSGADTPAGKMLRRYWIPACLSSAVAEPDCDPLAVKLLGEDYVIFRDSAGRVGCLDEHCCHRGASLLLGRVEGSGIRCLYHGWKFAVDGTVMETPNHPDPEFRKRVKQPAFPVEEAGGFVWVYLGPAETKPPLPRFPFMNVPESNRIISTLMYACNWVQAMEGGLDTSHLGSLHADALQRARPGEDMSQLRALEMTSPKIDAARTEHGMDYVSIRPGTGQDGRALARVTTFVAPWTVCIAPGGFWAFFIPVDDETTVNYLIHFNPEVALGEEPALTQTLRFFGIDQATLDAYGISPEKFADRKARPDRDNNYKQDRRSMRDGSYAGLPQFLAADYAVACSMGGIADRSRENLAPIDAPIAMMRSVLMESVGRVTDGQAPYGAASHRYISKIDAASGSLADGDDWKKIVPEHRFV